MITVGTCLGRAAKRGRCKLATPPDHDADLDQLVAAGVGADEHDHVVVLSDVLNIANRSACSMSSSLTPWRWADSKMIGCSISSDPAGSSSTITRLLVAR